MTNNQDLKLKVAELKDTIVNLRKKMELSKNKAYQVFKGEDYLGFTYYEHQATYFNRDLALEHCKRIVESAEFEDENITESTTGNKRLWHAHGWDIVTICKLEEIEII